MWFEVTFLQQIYNNETLDNRLIASNNVAAACVDQFSVNEPDWQVPWPQHAMPIALLRNMKQ